MVRLVDLAFHAVTLAHIDPAFAKEQLLLVTREWAQHPNGQLPAYEWAFSDVNPPVHAWAAWQVYLIDGRRDPVFLSTIATKLLLNWGWWVNRKDPNGSDLFAGGFLGMDNISVFDRSRDVPAGYRLEESDATSWMAFFCLWMLRIAQELARRDPSWDDVATTFLERFLSIAAAAESFGTGQESLWDEQDGFFYDRLVRLDGADSQPVRVRSLVGLVPLLATLQVPAWADAELPDYRRRRTWLATHRPELFQTLTEHPDGSHSLALVTPARAARLLERMLDPAELLSPHGIRSLSAAYRDTTLVDVAGAQLPIRYAPGESDTGMFGGNSNWRGPVWMPINALLVEAFATYAAGPGRALSVRSGRVEVSAMPDPGASDLPVGVLAERLREQLVGLFRPGPEGRRPGTPRDHPDGPRWVHPTFSEYFHGDTGVGLGASHQTGWTALVAHLICTRTTRVDPESSPG